MVLICLFTFKADCQHYIETGAGLSPWHQSHTLETQSSRFPIQIYLEYGYLKNLWSISGIYDFHSQYKLDNYELNPSFGGLFLNRILYQQRTRYFDIHLFAGLGLLYERHQFRDEGNANVPGYQLQEETKSGLGFGTRVGSKILWGKYVLTPEIQFLRSNQRFIAGQFSETKFQTGSTRIMITVGYRFKQNRYGKVTCPTYH